MKFRPYCRYSPRPEFNDATGTPVKSMSNIEQLALMQAKLNEQGHSLVGSPVTDENVSRDDIEREALFGTIRSECSRNVGLAVYDLDRLGDLLVIELTMHWLRKAGAKLWTHTGGIEGDDDDAKLLRGMKGLMNGREKSKSARRTSDVMRHLQSDGWAMGGIPPYGFKLVRAEGKTTRGNPKKRLVVDEYEIGVLRYIQRLVERDGLKSDAIAKILNQDGIQPREKHWAGNSLGRIIRRMPERLRMAERLTQTACGCSTVNDSSSAALPVPVENQR